ncbi:fatty acid binding protein 1-B.1-like [Anneissia japonica]|uniref:fatty acid binding protein 1-B.1-like n=1 Tax=Anneissia japonica TaxID=1529436 RepID=UPI0014258065|nr:fatty acid binding protein 1-B.1-like [Anneissia japonica]
MTSFSGKWALVSSDGMSNLLDALKVPAEKRPQDENATVEIDQSGDSFKVKTTTSAGARDVSFTVGTSFVDPDIKALRGKDISVMPSWQGSKLVLTGEQGNTFTRELVGGQMVVTLNFGGVVAKRTFNKV